MIELAVRLLRPLFVPLLKLSLQPPHLPEGSSLVRQLRPSDAWLTYRYLGALLGLSGQLAGAVVLAAAAVLKLGLAGGAVAVLLALIEVAGMGFALVTVRVDFELRHYLVGDRSLRVSMGALTRREVTLSYANVQNLEVSQGPLERAFGFKTLTVSTAGSGASRSGGAESMSHEVKLVGLVDAEAVRELILGMLRGQRDAGLGEAQKQPAGLDLATLAEVRDAARRLQNAVTAPPLPAAPGRGRG